MVDDDELVLETAMAAVESLGHHAVGAPNGAAAITRLQSDNSIDLLLTAVVMPGGISGHDLARWVRTNRPTLPVIISSGYNNERPETSPELTAIPFLAKPYNRHQLAQTIQRLLTANEPTIG